MGNVMECLISFLKSLIRKSKFPIIYTERKEVKAIDNISILFEILRNKMQDKNNGGPGNEPK